MRRSEAGELRDRAQALVQAFDAHHPSQSVMQKALALVRDLAQADEKSLDILIQRAEVLKPSLDAKSELTHAYAPAQTSRREVDTWILEMFRATESAIPREALVDDFIQRYRREHHIKDDARHKGPWLFEFEAITEQGKVIEIHPLVGAGVHQKAFQEQCQKYLPHWRDDPFLTEVLRDQYDIDQWYALPFYGSPLFDALIDIRRHFKGEADYWVNAVALVGDGGYNTRGLFLIYRNFGDPLFPEPPPGAREDMRLLTVLGLAWRQLEHQVRALARISESDRRDLINLIAPGLLHHEIGFNMRTAYGQVYEQFNLLKKIAHETGREDVELAARYAHGIAGLVLNIYQITDAFNNLDKRGQVEDSELHQVFANVKLLLHHRLGHAHTELIWDAEELTHQPLHTDVVLLSQAIINILNNALNALTEQDTPPPRRILAKLEHADTRSISLTLCNNGPPIPADQAKIIFRRGYTTRAQGHGQGLYLARLVTHYLGGDVTLMEKAALPEGFHAGFRLNIYRRLTTEQGIARAAD